MRAEIAPKLTASRLNSRLPLSFLVPVDRSSARPTAPKKQQTFTRTRAHAHTYAQRKRSERRLQLRAKVCRSRTPRRRRFSVSQPFASAFASPVPFGSAVSRLVYSSLAASDLLEEAVNLTSGRGCPHVERTAVHVHVREGSACGGPPHGAGCVVSMSVS